MARKREIRVGVAFGDIMDQMARHLSSVQEACPLGDVAKIAEVIRFYPLIGIVSVERRQQEAEEIAQRLASLYKRVGGEFVGLPTPGFTLEEGNDGLRSDLTKVIEELKEADVIISSGAPWVEGASLLKTGLVRNYCPPLTAGGSTIAGVFVDREGGEAAPCKYRVIGLNYDGLKKAAGRGSVVLVCGSRQRENTVRAALKGGLVSVVITSLHTAKAILR